MPIGSLKSCILAACVALAACTAPLIDDATEMSVLMPGPSTSSEEIASAIRDLIKTYPVCRRLHALRLVGRAVNFDRARGAAIEGTEEDLDALVRLGYLTKTALPESGERVFKYDRTERGQDTNIIGTSGLCFPADRVLVAVTSVERELNATRRPSLGDPVSPEAAARDGYLLVKFTHAADPKSAWVQEPDLVKLVGGNRAALLPGPAEGSARLSRVWIRAEHPLKGAPESGALWALSWDAVHNRYENGRWGGMYMSLWKSE